MFARTILLDEVRRLLEQILEPQQRANALVERIFVGNHAATTPEFNKFRLF